MRTKTQQAYADEFPTCQLYATILGWPSFRPYWFGQPRRGQEFRHDVEIHHLFSLRRRPDMWSNLLSVCRPVHRWCERYKVAGRVAAIWVKCQHEQFDWAELSEAAGKQMPGWLETGLASSDIAEAELLRQDLVERFC